MHIVMVCIGGLAAPGSSAEEKAAVFARSSGAMRKATSADQIYPEFRDLFKKEGAKAA